MSASSLKVVYYVFFHSAMSYGFIFWGNSSHSSIIFRIKKKQLELWKDVGRQFRVEIYSRNTNIAFDITIYVIFINVCS
jgi:hypothetical protein